MRFADATTEEIAAAWQASWGGFIVSIGRVYRPEDVTGAHGLDADGGRSCLVTWSVAHSEIVTLDARGPGRPGLAALKHAEERLAAAGLSAVRLVTTNDNVGAIALYLRSGYRVVHVHLDAMDEVRALKPQVPRTGMHGLPLRDAWELRKEL